MTQDNIPPEARAKVTEHQRKLWSDPERRAAESARKKALFADPVYKAQWLKAYREKTNNGTKGKKRNVPPHLRNYWVKMRSAGVPVDQRLAAIREMQQQP